MRIGWFGDALVESQGWLSGIREPLSGAGVIIVQAELKPKRIPPMRLARFFCVAVFVAALCIVSSSAQTPELRASTKASPEQSPSLPASATSIDVVASEIGLLRKSVQALNLRLREIADKVLASGSSQSGLPNDKQNRLSLSLEILSKAEQRAEALRKELLERIEKETALRSRLAQNEEELRPESIERALNPIGATRTVEIRDVRRRVLENEKRGFESLLVQTSQSRIRLEDDVKQADALVYRLRQRILPLIDREIEKLNPN